MQYFDKKAHWEKIYAKKALTEVSWYQQVPSTSLEFFKLLTLDKKAKIIDVGGGDSYLADYLLEMGYSNITVLDISESALQRAQQRLGAKAAQIQWITADISQFQPIEKYDFWHDRATFHFLTQAREVESYIQLIKNYLHPGGYLVIGTFSESGPTQCSGIPIRQYSEKTLSKYLNHFFDKIKCFTIEHITPFQTIQNFIFCSFKRLEL